MHDPWRTKNNFESQNTLNWSFEKEFKNCNYMKKNIILPYKFNNTKNFLIFVEKHFETQRL